MSYAQNKITQLTSDIGVAINGQKPWDVLVNDSRFFNAVLFKGSLGLGESYMNGWWDCKQPDVLFARILSQDNYKLFKRLVIWQIFSPVLIRFFFSSYLQHIFPKYTRKLAFKIGSHHYDIGNDLFKAMLDKRLTYTCGYWQQASNLDEAQEAKLDLVCRKIGLRPGDKVLDIGCGWGSFAKFAAERYGAKVVGITVSKEQVELGNKLCEGLPVEIRLQDYRDVDEKFDHIVSLGMFEHVQPVNYKEYMEIVARNLKKDGLFLLHTISALETSWYKDPWISTYIFPNSKLPSIRQISKSAEEGKLTIHDCHEFGADYDKTLMAWHQNFVNAWPNLQNNYSKLFYRMWTYYLLCCAGLFRAGKSQLWQIVLSHNGENIGYKSIR